jgi:hypothetical protein
MTEILKLPFIYDRLKRMMAEAIGRSAPAHEPALLDLVPKTPVAALPPPSPTAPDADAAIAGAGKGNPSSLVVADAPGQYTVDTEKLMGGLPSASKFDKPPSRFPSSNPAAAGPAPTQPTPTAPGAGLSLLPAAPAPAAAPAAGLSLLPPDGPASDAASSSGGPARPAPIMTGAVAPKAGAKGGAPRSPTGTSGPKKTLPAAAVQAPAGRGAGGTPKAAARPASPKLGAGGFESTEGGVETELAEKEKEENDVYEEAFGVMFNHLQVGGQVTRPSSPSASRAPSINSFASATSGATTSKPAVAKPSIVRALGLKQQLEKQLKPDVFQKLYQLVGENKAITVDADAVKKLGVTDANIVRGMAEFISLQQRSL